MSRSSLEAALTLTVLLLPACAQLAGLDMRTAEIGMSREQAIATLPGKPTTYTLRSGVVEYVLVASVKSFSAMYSDYPYAVTFIRLENDKVVDRGLVDETEEKRIKDVSPAFVLREWQSKDGASSYTPDP